MEITKKRLRQIIREEARFLAKEGTDLVPADIVAAYDEDPALLARLKLIDTKEEIKDYLRSVISALNAQSEQGDFENSAGDLNNLEMAVIELGREIQNNKFEFMPDEQPESDEQ